MFNRASRRCASTRRDATSRPREENTHCCCSSSSMLHPVIKSRACRRRASCSRSGLRRASTPRTTGSVRQSIQQQQQQPPLRHHRPPSFSAQGIVFKEDRECRRYVIDGSVAAMLLARLPVTSVVGLEAGGQPRRILQLLSNGKAVARLGSLISRGTHTLCHNDLRAGGCAQRCLVLSARVRPPRRVLFTRTPRNRQYVLLRKGPAVVQAC